MPLVFLCLNGYVSIYMLYKCNFSCVHMFVCVFTVIAEIPKSPTDISINIYQQQFQSFNVLSLPSTSCLQNLLLFAFISL